LNLHAFVYTWRAGQRSSPVGARIAQSLRVNFGDRYFPPVPMWIALVSRASRFQGATRVAREISTATHLLEMFQTARSNGAMNSLSKTEVQARRPLVCLLMQRRLELQTEPRLRAFLRLLDQSAFGHRIAFKDARKTIPADKDCEIVSLRWQLIAREFFCLPLRGTSIEPYAKGHRRTSRR
jgi:hypothetical protein